MLRKIIAPLLIGAVMLFVVPSKALAQTLAQTKAAESEHNFSDRQAKQKPDLKAAFAKDMANVKARTLTDKDYRRIEREQQSQQASKTGWTKNEKILFVVFIVGMTVVLTAIIIRGVDEDKLINCVEQPSDTFCTQ